MVYSVIVVPGMLGQAGFPPTAIFIATCLVTGFGSLLMGLWANLPMAIGCAISLTAFTTFSLVLSQQVSIPVALGAVFLMGCLFILSPLLAYVVLFYVVCQRGLPTVPELASGCFCY